MYKAKPSGSGRILVCTGSLSMEAKTASEGDRSYAEEGVLAAKLAEDLLNNEIVALDAYPEDMAANIQEYVEYILSLGGELMVEQDVLCSNISPFMANGRTDAIVVTPTHVHLIDLKYGFREVEVIKNKQLGTYALALEEGFPNHQFVFHIWQARSFIEVHKVWDVPADWLTSFRKDLVAALEKANSNLATLKTSEHCRYCRAKAVCPKLREEAFKALDELSSVNTGPSPLTIDQETLYYSQLERFQRILKDSITGIQESLIHKMKQGGVSTLYEYTESLSNRSWTVPLTVVEDLGKKNNVDLIKKSTVTPAQAEKLGIDKKIVAALTNRFVTGNKLKKRNLKKVQEIFAAQKEN